MNQIVEEEEGVGNRDEFRSREDRGPDDAQREQRRRQWRERMERWRNATPEERRQMRLDGMVALAARTYELDESQKVTVRREIEAIQRERRAAMGPLAVERDRLREQMGEYWLQMRERSRDSDDPGAFWRQARDDPRFIKIRDRMREIDRQFPNQWDESIRRIESLLPEEQARIGRQRLEQMRSRWAERRSRDDNRRDEGSVGRERRDRSEGFADRRDGDPRGGGSDRMRETPPRADRDHGRVDQSRRVVHRPAEVERAIRPLHPWQKHVQEFTARYKLSAAQSAAAQSILKELLKRAERIEEQNAGRVAEANRIGDASARQKRLAELNKPIDQLFEELKKRLNGLLTTTQRSKRK